MVRCQSRTQCNLNLNRQMKQNIAHSCASYFLFVTKFWKGSKQIGL